MRVIKFDGLFGYWVCGYSIPLPLLFQSMKRDMLGIRRILKSCLVESLLPCNPIAAPADQTYPTRRYLKGPQSESKAGLPKQ